MDGWSLEYSIDVDAENRLVYVKIFGSWKAHHAEEYHKDFESEASQLFNKPWARLVDLTSWKTSYPDVVEKIADHMHWCHDMNGALSVYAVNQPSTFRQLREMIAMGGIADEAKVFRTYEEAKAYIAEHWLKKKQKTRK